MKIKADNYYFKIIVTPLLVLLLNYLEKTTKENQSNLE